MCYNEKPQENILFFLKIVAGGLAAYYVAIYGTDWVVGLVLDACQRCSEKP